MKVFVKRTAFLLFCTAFLSVPSAAGIGYYKREVISGLNKICYYEGIAGTFTKTIGNVEICPLSVDDGRTGYGISPYGQSEPTTGTGSVIGYLKDESVSGFTKTCYYDGIRGTFTKTVGSVQICPISARQ